MFDFCRHVRSVFRVAVPLGATAALIGVVPFLFEFMAARTVGRFVLDLLVVTGAGGVTAGSWLPHSQSSTTPQHGGSGASSSRSRGDQPTRSVSKRSWMPKVTTGSNTEPTSCVKIPVDIG